MKVAIYFSHVLFWELPPPLLHFKLALLQEVFVQVHHALFSRCLHFILKFMLYSIVVLDLWFDLALGFVQKWYCGHILPRILSPFNGILVYIKYNIVEIHICYDVFFKGPLGLHFYNSAVENGTKAPFGNRWQHHISRNWWVVIVVRDWPLPWSFTTTIFAFKKKYSTSSLLSIAPLIFIP